MQNYRHKKDWSIRIELEFRSVFVSICTDIENAGTLISIKNVDHSGFNCIKDNPGFGTTFKLFHNVSYMCINCSF